MRLINACNCYFYLFQITLLGSSNIFIGSRLSDSVLLKFKTTPRVIVQASSAIKNFPSCETEHEGEKSPVSNPEDENQPVQMDTSPNGIEPSDSDVELYGPDAFMRSSRSFEINEYAFEVSLYIF